VKKALFFMCLAMALLMVVRLMTGPGGVRAGERTATTTITVNAQVAEFTEWADASPVIFAADWPGPIDKVRQKQTVAKQIVLYTNTNTMITAKPGLNNGVLTQGSQTLDTAYRLGGAVVAPDRGFKPAGEFFGPQNVYPLAHVPGTGAYVITLEVQMSSPKDAAPEEGMYVCGVTLTAGW